MITRYHWKLEPTPYEITQQQSSFRSVDRIDPSLTRCLNSLTSLGISSPLIKLALRGLTFFHHSINASTCSTSCSRLKWANVHRVWWGWAFVMMATRYSLETSAPRTLCWTKASSEGIQRSFSCGEDVRNDKGDTFARMFVAWANMVCWDVGLGGAFDMAINRASTLSLKILLFADFWLEWWPGSLSRIARVVWAPLPQRVTESHYGIP